MFRRKEETTNDSSILVAAPGAPAGGAHLESSALSAPSQPTASAGVQTAPSTYVPPIPAARSTLEPARSSSPMSNYRPTPIAEFNRGAARGTPETMRASAPTTTGASLGSAPDKPSATKSNRRVLTVGNDILLKGEIATCDRLVIEGRVEAKLSDVHTVEIAECGSFKGTAEVEDAEISGVFEGDLIVRNRLVIYASGEVRGNISYGEIEIERGGRMTGQIKTVAAGAQGAAAKAKPFEAPQDKQRQPAKETAAA